MLFRATTPRNIGPVHILIRGLSILDRGFSHFLTVLVRDFFLLLIEGKLVLRVLIVTEGDMLGLEICFD